MKKDVLCAENAALYEDFLDWQKQRVSKQGFISVKNRTFRLFKYLEKRRISPQIFTVEDALKYKTFVSEKLTKKGKKVTVGTCCNSLKNARCFFNFLVISGRRESNPFLAVPLPSLGEHISRNVLTEAQMNRLLGELRHFTDIKSYRVHVLSELLYSTGMRIAEAASLLPKDIDLKRRLVQVQQGKGGKSRMAFLTGYAATVLSYYKKTGRKAVIRSHRGKRKKSQSLFTVDYPRLQDALNSTLRETCGRLKIPVITSHGFRHSLGTHLLRSGCDIRYIQVILGHEKLETTQIYTHVNKDDLKKSLDTYHPRSKIKEGVR